MGDGASQSVSEGKIPISDEIKALNASKINIPPNVTWGRGSKITLKECRIWPIETRYFRTLTNYKWKNLNKYKFN